MTIGVDRQTTFRGLAIALVTAMLGSALTPTAAGAVAPGQSPTIVSPTPGETVNANPVLDWDPVAGAVKYRVQVSTSQTFSSLLYNPQDTTSTKATIPTDLPLGTIYWRVAATDGSSGVGPFSTSSFERVWSDAPQPTSPADDADLTYPNDAVSFAWEPLPGAKKYQVQVDDNGNFTTPDEHETVNPALTLKEPQTHDQTFYWRVRAVAMTGMNSAWSPARSYMIIWPDEPDLTSPADQTTTPVTDVVLDWGPVAGAATYQLQVSPNGDWANNIALDQIVKGTRYSPPITLNNSDYYWRVRARDGMAGTLPNLGRWSAVRQFKRGWPQRPVLVAPADNSTMTMNPTFEWEPVPHASHYQLDVSTDINFSSGVQSCVTTHTTYTPYVLVSPSSSAAKEAGPCPLRINIGDRYYWRVRGMDGPLNLAFPPPVWGLWNDFGTSDTFTFVYQVPTPTPTAPADGAQVHTPMLQWDPVQGQGRYRVLIYAENGTKEVDVLTYATSYTPTKRLAIGDYRWYVLTENLTSGRGINEESKHRWFTLVAPADPVVEPQLLTPAQRAPSPAMPAMSWEPVDGAHHYRVFYSPSSGTFIELTEPSAPSPYAGFTSTAQPLNPQTYQWFVRAYTQLGAQIAQSNQREFVISSLDVAAYTAPCSAGVSCIVGQTPTLEWEHVPNAGAYRVYLAVDPQFTNIIREYRTVFNTLTPRESIVDSQAGQSFYWFVRPCINPDTPATSPCGPFNNEVQQGAFSFRKQSAPAQQNAPAQGAEVADEATFSWTDYLITSASQATLVTQGARKYRIQVSTANTFSTILDEDYVDQTTYTAFNKTYPEGPLFWRVQAVDGSGNNLTFSDTRQLTKSSPPVQPLEPTSGSTVSRVPTFRWAALPFAAKYEVEVFRDADTLYSSTNLVASATGFHATKLTGWTPTTALPAGAYAWRVRRLDVDGRPGVWSGGGTFQLAAAVPQLISPSADAKIHHEDLSFTWEASSSAVQYRFQSSTSPSFSALFESQLTSAPGWAPSKAYPDGTYYWRIQVLDSASNVSATSLPRSFTKQTPMTTKLVLGRSPTTVVDTGTVVLSGKLTRSDTGAGLANRRISLMRRFANSTTWRRIAIVTTDTQGNITYRQAPKRFTVYQLRYPTNGVVVGSRSSGVLVKYQPAVKTLVSKTEIPLGNRAKLTGTISPYFRGRTILLQKQLASGRWKTIRSKQLGAPANTTPQVTRFAFPIYSGTKTGFFWYRVRFPARKNVNLGVTGLKHVVRIMR